MERNPCYCGTISKETMEKEGIPEGYCGLCEICNKPGHTQHFPGAVPYTGAWCDDCFEKIARKQQNIEKALMYFKPGFRISKTDVFVLVIGALSAGSFYTVSQISSLIILFVIGHFFIFCNITRMSRIPELIWSGIFLFCAGFSVAKGQPSWPATFVLAALTTIILVVLEIRKPGYHGIFWQTLNPNLPSWFEKNHTKTIT